MSTSYDALIPTFPLFKGYTPAGAQMLLERGSVKEYPGGQGLFLEGEAPNFALLILKGSVEVYVERGGKEVVLSKVGPGSIMGELSVLCGMNRSASARATEPTAALQWDANAFRRLLLGNSFLSEQILGHALRHLIEKERAHVDEALKQQAATG